ncbi:MAG: CPBP family intramembrane metalloprotease [Anaerolineales bacterium]|nr:CPBP family intramembrane metalloprotease [Anaerolineales bacterium]
MDNKIISLLWNPKERRLRALWRLLIQGSVWMSLQIGIGVAVAIFFLVAAVAAGWLPAQEIPGSSDSLMDLMNRPDILLILQFTTFLITLGSVWLAGRFLDRRKFSDFGFHFSPRWWLDLGFGLLMGAALMAGVFALELGAGWITVEGYLVTNEDGGIFPLAILIPLVMFVLVGISEELSSRGYQLKNMAEGMTGTRFGAAGAIFAATFFSSICFGLLHAANPNITFMSILNLMAAGVFLALGYILTGELALPIGLHIAWNFFQGNVFGFPVSGLDPVAARFIAIRQGGPEWMTGGAFGPEGGLIGLAAMLLGCILIFLWVKITRGKISLTKTLAEYQGKAPSTTKQIQDS